MKKIIISFYNAQIIKNHKYVTRPESLMWKGPDWLKPDSLFYRSDETNSINALMDSLLKAE